MVVNACGEIRDKYRLRAGLLVYHYAPAPSSPLTPTLSRIRYRGKVKPVRGTLAGLTGSLVGASMNLNKLPKIALVQMEVLPGRPDANVQRMLERIEQARAAAAEVVVFSEMCIPGYIVGDLWEIDFLVDDFASYSDLIVAASEDITVVFGNVAVDKRGIGEDGRTRKYNAVYVCSDRRYLDRAGVPAELPSWLQPKTLHPNYRFFDDDRHFYSLRKLAAARGRSVFDWMVPFEVERRDGNGAFRFGVELCEDMWCEDYEYACQVLDVVQAYHRAGTDAIFNLSSSPWTWQKGDKRARVVSTVLERSPLPFFYVNQVGAQNNGKNILVFDGDTVVHRETGDIAYRTQPWRECVLVTREECPPVAPRVEVEDIYHGIVTGLTHLDHIRGQPNQYLIGVSGGIDSSVVTCMLVEAFGSERVFAVNMPTRFNAEVTQQNAQRLCQALDVDYLSCPIQALYEQLGAKIKQASFMRREGEYTQLVDENIQARIRGSDILAGLAAKLGLIFTNNGNKTEVALGYATLYGDVNGAVAPIADLYKVQVQALAHYLNSCVYRREVIPENLINGEIVPSAELSQAQDVTRGLGDPIKYGYHDAVLRQFIEYRKHPGDLMQWLLEGTLFENLQWSERELFLGYFPDTATWVADLEWVARQMRINYFKRIQAPPIIVLSKRAFGFDLRESQLPEYLPKRYAALKARVLGAAIETLIPPVDT